MRKLRQTFRQPLIKSKKKLVRRKQQFRGQRSSKLFLVLIFKELFAPVVPVGSDQRWQRREVSASDRTSSCILDYLDLVSVVLQHQLSLHQRRRRRRHRHQRQCRHHRRRLPKEIRASVV